MHIGNNIKYLRKGKGLTQIELGELFSITGTQVSAYESGKSAPSFEGLLKLSEYFNVSLDDLVYKDLTKEDARPAPASITVDMLREAEVKYEAASDSLMGRLLTRIEKRLSHIEQQIRERDPEWAKELGIGEE